MSSSSSEGNVCCGIFNCTKKDLVKAGFYRNKPYANLVCCGCGWQSEDTKITVRHLNFLHKLSNPDCEMSSHTVGDFINYSKYKKLVMETEEAMRETYFSWPKLYPLIDDLVKAGFYYIGTGDSTSCISCGVTLEDWRPEDNPLEEHKKASPFCDLLNM